MMDVLGLLHDAIGIIGLAALCGFGFRTGWQVEKTIFDKKEE